MKTLYSSTFLSVVLGFLVLLDQADKPIELVKAEEQAIFRTIIERADIPLKEDGKIHLDIFTGFTCENCKAFGQGALRQLNEIYGKDEKVALTVHFIANKEDEADFLAVKSAECALNQDKLWQMTQKLYEMEVITAEEVNLKAEELQLDVNAFGECLNSEETIKKVDEALSLKETQKIEILPSTLVNNMLLIGAHPVENVEREIRRANNL